MSQNSQINQTYRVANLISQVGCVTGLVAIAIIAVSFGAGWLIDGYLGNERKFVTIVFVLGSFPLTLFAMVRISLGMVNRAQQQMSTEQTQQEERDQTEP